MTKRIIQKIIIVFAIAVIVINFRQVQAQTPPSLPVEKTLVFAAPPPPPDVGQPGQRSHAGSRGCEDGNNRQARSEPEKRLVALVPAYQSQDSELVWGLTTSERPTFWFYIPHRLTSEDAIEFVLKDDRDNYVYKTKFAGGETSPGIVNLRLPPNVSLESDRNYAWYFLIYCQSPTPASYVNGFIKRVNHLNFKNQLASAQPRDRIILYAEQGIWYEAITELAQLRRANANNGKLDRDWKSLLRSVGLEDIAEKLFVPCCSAEE